MANRMTGQIVVRYNHLSKLAADGRKAVQVVVRKTALAIEGDAKSSMRGGGIPHQPSPPGTPPNIETATLVNTIQTVHVAEMTSVVRVGADYGLDLELGTRKMPARPFMGPAAKRQTPAFIKGMEAAYK
jgi:HK97 gp10 family phage protein